MMTITVRLTVNGREVPPCGCGSHAHGGEIHWGLDDLEVALGRQVMPTDVIRIDVEKD